MVGSYYLETKQLGQLLLLTSKEMTAAVFSQDEVWRHICCSHFGFENGTNLLKNAGPIAPETIVRTHVSSFANDSFQLNPLLFQPQDYVVTVVVNRAHWDVNRHTGTCMFCKSIEGGEIPSFFETGQATITFDQPLCMAVEDGENRQNHVHWKAIVCIFRKADQQCIKVAENSVDETIEEEDGKLVADHGASIIYTGPFMPRTQPLFWHFFGDSGWEGFRVHPELVYRRTNDDGKLGIFGFSLTAIFIGPPYEDEDEVDVDEEQEVPSATAIKEKRVTFSHFLEAAFP